MIVPEMIAKRLQTALETRTPIPPLSESEGLADIDDAYAVQAAWTAVRVANGERIVGRKIGLTNHAMREQMGVSEPDYGTLLSSGQYAVEGGRARVRIGGLISPMIEPEIALRIGRPLTGPDATAETVMAVTEAFAPAIEVLDSRIEDWRIRIVDTVADNASYAGFVVGPWDADLLKVDLATLGVVLRQGDMEVARGTGAAALGHPATAIAWLANKLHSFGVGLEAGDIVLSGSLTNAVQVHRGDSFVLAVDGQPPLCVDLV